MLLVEGVAGAGKSTLTHALVNRYATEIRPLRSLLHLSQAHTYGPLAVDEDRCTLTCEQNVAHLKKIRNLLEHLSSPVMEEPHAKFYGIIDSLHFTQCVRPGVLLPENALEFDKLLAQMGCKLIFLHVSENELWKRIQERRETDFIQYARKFGSTLEKIHEYFVSEQESMARIVRRSCMSTLVVDNTQPTTDNMINSVFDFWISQ